MRLTHANPAAYVINY